jgi:hypothetical protein
MVLTDRYCPAMRAHYPRFLSYSLNTWSIFGVGDFELFRVSLTAGCAAWQGMELPIPWDQEGGIEASQDEVRHLVTPQRLPPGVKALRDPVLWEEDEVLAWWMHILSGQQGSLPLEDIFQFQQPAAVDDDDLYCEDIPPANSLQYSSYSRLWVARLLLQAPDDLLVRAEVTFQMLVLDASHEAYRPLCSEDMATAKQNAKDHEDLLKLLVYMVEYEEITLVQVRTRRRIEKCHNSFSLQAARGHWRSMWETCPYFPREFLALQSGVEILGGWELPNDYYHGSQASNDYSMQTFSKWLCSGILNHWLTSTLMGGPYGLKWAVLILLRTYYCLQMGGCKWKAVARGSLDPEKELDTVQADISWLCQEVESSSTFILCSQKDPLPPFVPSMHDNIVFQRAQHHAEPLRDVCPPEKRPPVNY